MLALVPEFARTYQAWRPDSSLQHASLVQLNSTFAKWSHPQHKGRVDYNQLANKILDLSKTYNMGAAEEEGPLRKKRKQNELVKSEAPSRRVKQEGLVLKNSIGNNSMESNLMGHSMRLRSRGLE